MSRRTLAPRCRLGQRLRDDRGSESVELAIVLPVAFLVLGLPLAHLVFGFGQGAKDAAFVGGALMALAIGLVPFTGFIDTVAPTIQRIALYDGAGARIVAKKGQPVKLSRALGEVQVVVNAYDQVNGNLARRKLGLYKLGYQVLRADGTPLPGFEQPVITQVYDRLPRNPDAVKAVYAPTRGITVYGSASTQFDYALNNRLRDGRIETGSWRIADLAPGEYLLRIHAADYAGQVAQNGRDLAFVIE